MYTVAFYSFKGGVGRTMALMNVAADLVSRGRRVLVVDFDLEAPGVGTFDLLAGASSTPGVLEFVTSYIKTGDSPDICDYVYQVPNLNKGELLYMPAGRHDQSYGLRLSTADWGDLYQNKSGYLLLEDLKAQWKSAFAPDYVLIDSRTGHTDVAGICTRQLPDAVVALYFPNDQNLIGLQKIISDIRAESGNKTLHFVPSNVPDLDDENGILASALEKFQKHLRFEEAATVIHHNNSLALLSQELFVTQRPNTTLAAEYRALTQKIQSANVEDAEGAVLFLEKIHAQISKEGLSQNSDKSQDNLDVINDRLIEIFNKHARNERVLDRLLRIWLNQGDILQSLSVLDRLVDVIRSDKAEYHFRRALLRLGDAETDEKAPLSDARIGLTKNATYFDLRYFLNFVRRSQQTRLYAEMLQSSAFEKLEPDSKINLLKYVTQTKEAQPVIIGELERLYRTSSGQMKHSLMDLLSRCLIATGRFVEACNVYEGSAQSDLVIQDKYNYAIAQWASTQVVNSSLFNTVLSHPFETMSANTLQCLSLASCLVGKRSEAISWAAKARDEITRDNTDTFSGWRYCRVSAADFLQDLDSQLQMINGNDVKPAFLEYKPLTLAF